MTTDVMLMKVTLNFFGGSGSIQVRERKGGRKRSKFGELPNRLRLSLENVGLKSVSEKLCTYPFPNQTFISLSTLCC